MRRIDVKLLNTTKSTLKCLTINVGYALGVAKKKKKKFLAGLALCLYQVQAV